MISFKLILIPLADKTCYMAENINTVDLGNVGDIIEALVLHPIENGYRYAICLLDYDLMTHVFDIMPKKVIFDFINLYSGLI